MEPEEVSGKTLVIGFAAGALIGAGFSYLIEKGLLSGFFGLPGLLVGIIVGAIRLEGYGYSGQLVYAGVNAFSYGALGVFIAWAVDRLRGSKNPATSIVPQCPICGFKWAVPSQAECPDCSHPRAFTSWVIARTVNGSCKRCGYDLTGISSARCPECGEEME